MRWRALTVVAVLIGCSLPEGASAQRLSCADIPGVRSQASRAAVNVTFVNESSGSRTLSWVDFNGALKDYGHLSPRESKPIRTFHRHIWMVGDGPGNCLQVLAAGPPVVRMLDGRIAFDRAANPPAPLPPRGEEGEVRGCPPGTVPVPETDDCRAAPRGTGSAGAGPVAGRSFGGVLRSQPAIDSGRLMSVRENEPIVILQNAGVSMGGYDWFRVRVGGRTGFHWGGILCSTVSMPGVLSVCQ